MSNRKTAVQESAQALFCAMADYLGEHDATKVFDVETHTTYPEFKEAWDSKNKSMTVEATFKNRVDAPTVTLKDIEDLLKSDIKWYKSSVYIAKYIIKEVNTINKNFTKIKAPKWSDLLYVRDDKEIASALSQLFSLANNTQKQINAQPNSKKGTVFLQVNKWSPADIYFSSAKANKDLNDLLHASQGKSLTFGELNGLISALIDSGDLLPLSLKQQPEDRVELLKVNFDRKEELRKIAALKYLGLAKPWKPYVRPKAGAAKTKKEARYISMGYDPSNSNESIAVRHDPETPAFKAEIVHKGGTVAREGSAAPKVIASFIAMAEGNTNYSRKFLSAFDKAEAIFTKIRHSKEYIALGIKNRDKFKEEREWHSANLFTNVIFPDLVRWLERDKERSSRFVRLFYTYATSRSENSAKFVVAK